MVVCLYLFVVWRDVFSPSTPPHTNPHANSVKFLVDDQWRLAPDWPTADDGKGNTVNLLTVAPDA